MSHESQAPAERAAADGWLSLFAWSLAAALVLLAALAGPCFFGRVYTHDDLGAFHLPLRAFYARQLALGEPFDWMPQLFSGFYVTGEGQLGAYHPLHLALYRFLPLKTAWACELLASYPFMLAGAYLFLRRLVGRADAAMFGSLVFTFSGFNLLHFVHPNAIAVVAHIPWLLWAIDVALVESGRNRVAAAHAGIALLTGSQLLLGYPQYVWFSLLAEAGYGLFVIAGRGCAMDRSVGRGCRVGPGCRVGRGTRPTLEANGSDRVGLVPRPTLPSPALPRPTLPRRMTARLGNFCWRLALAKGTGLMLGGIQLLPTVDALGHSARRSADAAFLDSGSLHPLNLVQLIAPYLFTHRVVGENTHELGLYVGAVPLVLMVWLLLRRRARRRSLDLAETALDRPLLAAAGFGLVALLLAFGAYGPIYRFQRLLPLVGSLRFPCRYTVLASLCVAVLAAIGVATLAGEQERNEKTPWRRLWPVGMLVAVSVLVTALGLGMRHEPYIGAVPAVLAGPLLVGLAAALLCLSARGARWAPAGLVLFAAADLGFYGMSYAVYPGAERFETYLAAAETPPGPDGGRVLADLIRFDEPGLRTGNQMILSGWTRADGYAGLEPARRLDYRELPALRAAGVRWVHRSDATAAISGLCPYNEQWLEVPEPLKRVRLVTQALSSEDPARDIGRISLESTALVDMPLKLPTGPPGVATVVADRPGRVHVRVDAPTSQLLLVSESHHPGWKAEIDGTPHDVLRANGDFLGCVVPPGKHEVVLAFRPQSLRNGWIVSCLGFGLASFLVVGPWLKRTPDRPGTGSFFGPFRPENCACPLPTEGDSPISADVAAKIGTVPVNVEEEPCKPIQETVS